MLSLILGIGRKNWNTYLCTNQKKGHLWVLNRSFEWYKQISAYLTMLSVLHLWAHLRLGLSLLLTLCSNIIEHTILVCILIPACFCSFAVFLKNALLLIYWHNCTNYICEVSYQHILVQWTDLSLSLIILNRKLLNFFFAIFKTSVLTLILFIKMFLSEFCFERDTR